MSSTEPDGVNPFAEDLQAAVAPMPEAPPFVLPIVTAAESARGPYRGIGRFGSQSTPTPPRASVAPPQGPSAANLRHHVGNLGKDPEVRTTMLSSSGGEGTDRDRGTAPASAPAGGDLDDDDGIPF